jgi:peptide/nickel transport system permease protein
MTEPDAETSSSGTSAEIHREARLLGLSSFALWPALIVGGLLVGVVRWLVFRLRHGGARAGRVFSETMKLALAPRFSPGLARDLGNRRLRWGMILLLPMLVTTLIAFVLLLFPTRMLGPGVALQPPLAGWGCGTDGAGLSLLLLIVRGAPHTYFSGLFAVLVAGLLGTWLGSQTYYRRREPYVTGLTEAIEAPPLLFVMLILLMVLSWWESEARNLALVTNIILVAGMHDLTLVKGTTSLADLLSVFRPLVVGIGLGIGFAPKVMRLVRGRIKTLASEQFIDAARAHGLPDRHILKFHIIRKNVFTDILALAAQVWAFAILTEIGLDFIIRLSPTVGAKVYHSWAGMLLTDEARRAILQPFHAWWLWAVPVFFIVVTIVGLYLFCDGLEEYQEQAGLVAEPPETDLDRQAMVVGTRLELF